MSVGQSDANRKKFEGEKLKEGWKDSQLGMFFQILKSDLCSLTIL